MAICNSIKLEKGMYAVGGKSFTKVLEELDPSENYKGTALDGLDAYQRQLKRFDIKVSGPCCDKVEKFFSTPDSAVLFPEFIARAVKQGLEASSVLPSIVAATTVIDGTDYRAITATSATSADGVSQATAIPSVDVKADGELVSLKKHGRVFSSSYEALRFQNIDVLAVILRQIGADIAKEQLDDAVKVLDVEGATEVSGLTYNELLTLWENLAPYELNAMLASKSAMKAILAMSEMRDAVAGLDFQGTGKIVTPLGAKLVLASGLEGNKIIGFDKNCTLQMIQDGDLVVDYDKVIDKQLNRAAISMATGFAKINNNSVKSIIVQ